MKQPNSIFWFRKDLRLSDNPILMEASLLGEILPIYIFDNQNQSPFKIGSASKVYLHHSLEKLNQSLNNKLNLYIGKAENIILHLIEKYQIKNIFWNCCYEPHQVFEDEIIKKKLLNLKINHISFNGSYLWNPEKIKNKSGSYYKIFTAYRKKVYFLETRKPIPKPENLILIKDEDNPTKLSDLKLIPEHKWYNKIEKFWTFGENAAQNKLDNFLHNYLSDYKNGRDYPSRDQTSKLSVNLHFGEISPNQIWESINTSKLRDNENDISHFLNEIIWREFSCYLMTHFKELPYDNFQEKFNKFPWEQNNYLFNAWKNGKTGYPIVDAGMRELWQTGYMHNRVRMISASFLTKNLMIHWHYGRDWFWECLVDADLANNSASWQWVAGCGADAAPYFRIFNPVIQGEKFDKNGDYTKKFIPELKNIPNKYLFKPWAAPQKTLESAGIILGKTYPNPIIDITSSRKKALNAYKKLCT